MSRFCIKCKAEKSETEFYKKLNGLQPLCKECSKKYNRSYYIKNSELLKKKTKQRHIDNPEYDKLRRKKYPDMYAKYLSKSDKKRRMLFPAKIKARAILNTRIRAGVILRKPCLVCSCSENVHGHHEDYSKPLEVVWLCNKHHKEIHTNKRSCCA